MYTVFAEIRFNILILYSVNFNEIMTSSLDENNQIGFMILQLIPSSINISFLKNGHNCFGLINLFTRIRLVVYDILQ